MRREPNEHFGAYLYICPDWAEHLKVYEAAHPGKVNFELEGEEGRRGAQVENLEMEDELMEQISSYGIVRYSYLDEGDDCCPNCKQQIDIKDAVEVDLDEAIAALARSKAAPLSL